MLPGPDPDDFLPLGAGDEASVRAKCDTADCPLMLNMGDLTPAGDFPDSCRSIGTRGGKMAAVRTEGDGRRTGGLCEPRDLLPGGPVPNANETFPSASGQEQPLGLKCARWK